MAKTVVGLTENSHNAHEAIQELVSNDFPRNNINIIAEENPEYGLKGKEEIHRIEGHRKRVEPVAGGTVGELTRLGMPESDARIYAEGVKRGGILLTVQCDDDRAEKAASIMSRNGAIDIDRAAWRREGASTEFHKQPLQGAALPHREGVIPVVEEELEVGKRQVVTGGVRVYSHVVQQPVEEQVTLREERAKVERRPVDRPLTGAEGAAFEERSFEITESTEEPVVSKQARVKEEVFVGKQTAERAEKITDTVRRTDVEVEKTGQTRYSGAQQTFGDEDFMHHFSSNYATRGERFDAYRSAYHYAESKSSLDPSVKGRDWREVEEDIHQDWEKTHPGTWARFKDAIHYGWDRTRKR